MMELRCEGYAVDAFGLGYLTEELAGLDVQNNDTGAVRDKQTART
jgi:hypothetical protein